MGRAFKKLDYHGYPLIDFLLDISKWTGDPPELICVEGLDLHLGSYIIGIFIFNEIDRCYYLVKDDGSKPKLRLEDCLSVTDYSNLNGVLVHGAEYIPSLYSIKLGRKYSSKKDFSKWGAWLDNYRPNKFK